MQQIYILFFYAYIFNFKENILLYFYTVRHVKSVIYYNIFVWNNELILFTIPTIIFYWLKCSCTAELGTPQLLSIESTTTRQRQRVAGLHNVQSDRKATQKQFFGYITWSHCRTGCCECPALMKGCLYYSCSEQASNLPGIKIFVNCCTFSLLIIYLCAAVHFNIIY